MNRPVARLNRARVGVASASHFVALQVAGESPSAPLVVREPDGELVASLLGVVANQQPLARAQGKRGTSAASLPSGGSG
jgi:phosphoribosylaminoimidazole (AIR) synthetase